MGASLGGIAAIVAAANVKPPLDGVAAISASRRSRGASTHSSSAPRLRVPALYVAAERDQNDLYDFAADAQRLFEATSPDKRLELVPGRCTASSW